VLVLAHLAEVLLAAMVGYQAPRLTTVVPPAAPWNVVIGNTVLVVAQVNEAGTVTHVRLVQGVTPFTDEAVKGISQWKFEPAHVDGHAAAGEISVLVMFRPHAFGNAGLGGPSFGFTPPEVPNGDHPVLPHFIFDPGWPIQSINAGVVVFELDVTENGTIDWIRIVRDVPAMADFAKDAVRRWVFTPAVVNGRPVRSRTVVAISFLTPVLYR